jgi:hypothetical protein
MKIIIIYLYIYIYIYICYNKLINLIYAYFLLTQPPYWNCLHKTTPHLSSRCLFVCNLDDCSCVLSIKSISGFLFLFYIFYFCHFF